MKIAKDDKALLKWERACKVMTALSMRLRLSPQSRTPTHSGARPSPSGRAARPINYLDRMKVESDGNGHDEQHDDQ
jgi:hypothetical protein